jgi:hypothetical protein
MGRKKKSYLGKEARGWILVKSEGYRHGAEYYLCKCKLCGRLKSSNINNLRSGRVALCPCKTGRNPVKRHALKNYVGPINNIDNNSPIIDDETILPYMENLEVSSDEPVLTNPDIDPIKEAEDKVNAAEKRAKEAEEKIKQLEEQLSKHQFDVFRDTNEDDWVTL